MAFDPSMPAPPLIPAPAGVFQQPSPAAPQTLLELVSAREAQLGIEAPAEHKITFADVAFATFMTTLSVAAALAGITAAVFLIGLGLAIYLAPVIAAVGLGVTFLSATLLVFRKEIRQWRARIARKSAQAGASAAAVQTA